MFIAHDFPHYKPLGVREQGNHAIAKMTARCAQYVSALKIVGLGKRKISR